jgi:hypothetical protein
MTTPGRSPVRSAGTRRPAAIGIMLVGLTFAMLTLAGTTPLGIGRAVDDPARVTLDQRVFSCTGGIRTNTARSGDLRNGLAKVRTVGADPVRIVADRTVARGAFAGQQFLSAKVLAWVPCPEPHATWWFVGAGSAAVTHDTVLTVTNPRPGAAVIDVDVFGTSGPVTAPGLHGITVGGRSTRVIDLAKTAPTIGTVSVSVTASRGLIAVTAADRFAPGVLGTAVREWLPPQPVPGEDLVLAGLPMVPGSATLVLVNPGMDEAIAKVQVIGSTGTFTPEGLAPISVAPQSVVTVPITTLLDKSPMAVRISSDQPLTGTIRSTKTGDTAFATGVQLLRDSTTFGLPRGSGRLVLSSLEQSGSMQVVGYDLRGRKVLSRTVQVAAGTSVGVRLSSRIRYLRLIADRPALVGGFAVGYKKGIASAGVAPAIRSIRLPAVRPGW